MIVLEDVSFGYDKTLVLENVNLAIKNHELVGIFGPNGGGKTTLLKLLMGFLKPTRGTIQISGTSPKAASTRIGYVPQITRFDKQFPLSVLDVVLMGALSKLTPWGTYPSEVKKKAREILAQVGLIDKENQAFGTLSGGQAQRTLIARALLSDPELLLLDEPTASIDPAAEEDVYQLLNSLKGKMAILMVTHDLQSILHWAGRLLCVRRTVTSYLPSELCSHFALGLYHDRSTLQ